ncbi:hypothetical protein MTBLM5_20208 [Magnetospirillum sp. LM-5]|uniref:hypothetical protein n=1 Tax=Magnetospirillum sp. LM-5 TaxID=2681466 RepID=UPI001386347A|nr:hypothetical protein [Magnetospirillum sp. LM-5]CAA7616739.1 hypothetical protein MTBLM5_20208 [Magnetospirillum sp. LM-5]
MSRDQIEHRLLVSASARRPDQLNLERRCAEHGFSPELTGQFGIGALSYFMLADRVEFTTRTLASADTWTFVSEGLDDFGELRWVKNLPDAGTEVRLRLRPRIERRGKTLELAQPADLWPALNDYLQETVIHTPCRVLHPLADGTMRNGDPGWFRPQEWYAETAVANIALDPTDAPHPAGKTAEREATEALLAMRRKAARDGLTWTEEQWEEDFANLGLRLRGRALSTLFPSSAGPMPMWIDEGPEIIEGCRWAPPQERLTTAWRGMALDLVWEDNWQDEEGTSCYWQQVELDIIAAPAATLAAHRGGLTLPKPTRVQVVERIEDRLHERHLTLLADHRTGRFGGWLTLNSPVWIEDWTLSADHAWVWNRRRPAPPDWPLAVSMYSFGREGGDGLDRTPLQCDGQAVGLVQGPGLYAFVAHFPPDRLVYRKESASWLYQDRPSAPAKRHRWWKMDFPSDWQDIDVISGEGPFAVRTDSPLAAALAPLAAWAKDAADLPDDIRSQAERVRAQPSLLLLWLMHHAFSRRRLNTAIMSAASALIGELWPTILPACDAIVVQGAFERVTLRRDGSLKEERTRLPRPADPKWRLDD